MKHALALLLFLLTSLHIIAQKPPRTLNLDSLKSIIDANEGDTNQLKALFNYAVQNKELSFDEKEVLFGDALQLAEKLGEDKKYITVYSQLNLIYLLQGDIEKAIANYKSLLERAEALDDRRGLLVAHQMLGVCYSEQGDMKKGLEYYLGTLKYAGSKSDSAMSYSNISNGYFQSDSLLKSMRFAEQSIELYEQLGNRSNIAAPFHAVGVGYMKAGLYNKALDSYQKAAIINTETKNFRWLCTNFLEICEIYVRLENADLVEEYADKAIEVADKLADPEWMAKSKTKMAQAYKLRGDYSKAIELFHEAYSISSRGGKPHQGLGMHNSSLGLAQSFLELYELEKRAALLDSAEVWYQLAEDYGTRAELLGILNAGLCGKAAIAFHRKQFAESKAICAEVIANSYQTQEQVDRAKTYELLASIYEAEGEYKKANEYFVLYITSEDSIRIEDEKKSMEQTRLQNEYERAKISDSLKFVHRREMNELQIARQEAELAKSNTTKYGLIGGLSLSMILAGVSLRSFRRRKKANLVLSQQMEKARLARVEAEEQKKIAEESDRFKQLFLAKMSHEIRTPMNAVLGMTQLMLEKEPKKEHEHYLEVMKESADGLLVILNDILDSAKIEEGKLELESTPFQLRKLVKQVQDTLALKVEEKGLLFQLDMDENCPDEFVGDPGRLKQILINLTNNAIKFTEKGKVKITVECRNSPVSEHPRIYFEVSDTGIGMTQDQSARIFEKFEQAEKSTSRKHGGTGLGLSIAQALVVKMGGQLSVKSSVDVGSRFSFQIDLPVTKIEKKQNRVSAQDYSHLAGLHIAAVEDNEYNRSVLKELLELRIPGVKLQVFARAEEFLKSIDHGDSHFDLLIFDIHLPKMNGFELTAELKAREPFSAVPIIALTASVLSSDVQQIVDAGMDAYVAKPLNVTELIQQIEKLLKQIPKA